MKVTFLQILAAALLASLLVAALGSCTLPQGSTNESLFTPAYAVIFFSFLT